MPDSVFIDTIKGIKRERPPVWFMRQAGRVLPSYLSLREKYSFHEIMHDPELAAEVTLLPVFDLDVDAAILFSDILVIPEALGMKLHFSDKGPVFETPLSHLTNPVSGLNPEPSNLNHIYKTIDIIKNKKSIVQPLIGFCGGPFTLFCYMVQGNSTQPDFPEAIHLFYNDPKTTAAIFEIITELSVTYATTQAIHGIDTFQLFETHAGLIPSDCYIEKIVPYVKRITKAVRSKNIPVIFFPKGLGNGLSKINADTADFISIDWQFPLEEARKMIDQKTGIQGNLDPRILSVTNPDILKKELEKFLPFGQRESNWIFNTGHGVSPDNTFENVKFVVDWIKSTNWHRN